MNAVYISLFGIVGVLSRYGLGLLITRSTTSTFPFGTLTINLVGSFLIGGLFVVGVERPLISSDLRNAIAIGFLGGFTTFSSYCLETFRLLHDSQPVSAAVYFLISPCLGLLATFLGVVLMRYALKV